MNILVASQRKAFWKPFLPLLEQKGGFCDCVESLDEAVENAGRRKPDLVILDLGLQGVEIRDAVIRLLLVDAAIHTAVVSNMEPEAFHEFTEGLGILCSLPIAVRPEDLEALLEQLARLS